MMNEVEIVKLGNPKLRLVSEPIPESEFGTSELQKISELLFHMMKTKGGVGIAAPQIGINKRMFVFGMEKHPVYTSMVPVPYTVLINPELSFLTEEKEESYEGCLSIGSLRAKVPRYKKIFYTGFDVEGNKIEREVTEFHARVIQHEYDHLDGIVFLDRVVNYKSLGFHEELIASGLLKINY
jgi:peptide deformylase